MRISKENIISSNVLPAEITTLYGAVTYVLNTLFYANLVFLFIWAKWLLPDFFVKLINKPPDIKDRVFAQSMFLYTSKVLREHPEVREIFDNVEALRLT